MNECLENQMMKNYFLIHEVIVDHYCDKCTRLVSLFRLVAVVIFVLLLLLIWVALEANQSAPNSRK